MRIQESGDKVGRSNALDLFIYALSQNRRGKRDTEHQNRKTPVLRRTSSG
jgi:hypothetical protein